MDSSWEVLFGNESEGRTKMITEMKKDEDYFIKSKVKVITPIIFISVFAYALMSGQGFILSTMVLFSGILNLMICSKILGLKKQKKLSDTDIFNKVYERVLPYKEYRETDISGHIENIESLIDELTFFKMDTKPLEDLIAIMERLKNVTLVSVQVNYILPIIRKALVELNNNRDDYDRFQEIISNSLIELETANMNSREHITKENKSNSELLEAELEQVKSLNK